MINDSPTININRQEFKEILTDNLERDVVAFLNSKGGRIYIGMRKDGTVVGVDSAEEMQLHIKERFINNIRPGIMGLFDVFMEQHENKQVIVIVLAGGIAIPYYIRQYGRSEKGCFVRTGNATKPMTEEHIQSLMQHNKRDSLTNIVSLHQDLTFNQLKIFYEEKGKLLNAHFAKTLDFLTPDGKYNQLAFLFADKNNISIRVAKWWGTDKIDLRENEEYGECSLIKAMQKVLDKFDIENVTLARKVGTGTREEKKLVDSKALRESIVNSFVHNEYTAGDTPVFEIFADRFEFTSYGGLIDGMTQEDFYSGVSRPRNPEIMRIFKDLDYVERLGSGIPYIVKTYGIGIFKLMPSVIRVEYEYDKMEQMEETDLKLPQNYPDAFHKDNQFAHSKINKSYLNHLKTPPILPYIYPKVKNVTLKILQQIQKNPFITIEKLAIISGLTKDGVRWNIRNLRKSGVVFRVGSNRGGYWEISKLPPKK